MRKLINITGTIKLYIYKTKCFSMTDIFSFSEILARVRQQVVDQFCLDSLEDLDNDAQFIRDLGADSLDVVQLVINLEEKFKVSIGEANAKNILTVRQAAEFIARLLNVEIQQVKED